MNEEDGKIGSNKTPPGEAILLAAKAHGASIKRTLWLREYKRKHGRAAPMIVASKPDRKSRDRGCVPPVIDGQIYSPGYWRTWQRRSRAKAPAIQDSESQRPKQSRTARFGAQLGTAPSTTKGFSVDTQSCISHASRLVSYIPSPLSSSFAGGRPATEIFAIPDTSALMQVHHNAVVRPPRDGSKSEAARVTASNGVLFSQSRPRPPLGNQERGAGGRYDIAKADRWVMPTASRLDPGHASSLHVQSYSFGSGRPSRSESALQGISRETPGAIYHTITRSRVPGIHWPPVDCFPASFYTFGTPGPGAYTPEEEGVRYPPPGAVSWTGPDTVMDRYRRCNPARTPRLRSWKGFGYGCRLKEHIDYGACLDGRCCTRHSVELKNALRVVQFLGQGDPGKFVNTRAADCGRRGTQHQASSQTLSSDEEQIAGLRKTEGREGEVIHPPPDHSDGPWSSHPKITRSVTPIPRSAASTEGKKQFGCKRVPLHFAAERGDVSLVDRLCKQGDDRNTVDERGQTPLHVAAETGNTRVVEMLLRKKEEAEVGGVSGFASVTERPQRSSAASVNVKDSSGRTPLYLGCLHGHERVVEALLKAGSDPNLADVRGRPPQEIAEQQHIYQILQLKADVSLVKARIAALEERDRQVERRNRDAEQAWAHEELEKLKREEQWLKTALESLEEKRAVYATANPDRRHTRGVEA